MPMSHRNLSHLLGKPINTALLEGGPGLTVLEQAFTVQALFPRVKEGLDVIILFIPKQYGRGLIIFEGDANLLSAQRTQGHIILIF
jgi:hypothetical protein